MMLYEKMPQAMALSPVVYSGVMPMSFEKTLPNDHFICVLTSPSTAYLPSEMAGAAFQSPPETTLAPLAAFAENQVPPSFHPPVRNAPVAIVSPPWATV